MSRAIEAVIFDTDGVVTRTAAVHRRAWKRTFDGLLARLSADGTFEPFSDDDYRRYVDGRPRLDGIVSFLVSRGIDLPFGSAGDPPGFGSVNELGNTKNGYFLAQLREHGVEPYASTVELIGRLHGAGIRTAVISASRNCAEVLESAGVADLFEARVDGVVSAELGLAGKPDPAVFLEAGRRLGVDPSRTAIVEDAIAGVEAGRRGGFALVVGVDRTGNPEDLERFADIVVSDLSELGVGEDLGILSANGGMTAMQKPEIERGSTAGKLLELPSALDEGLIDRLARAHPVVLLDYDGTLTPIVSRPELAVLDPLARVALERLAAETSVGIISGRDLADVRTMVALDGLWYAGSHGFDLLSPDGSSTLIEAGVELVPVLDDAERALRDRIDEVPEAWIERKRFAIAVHYRQTPEDRVDDLASIVRAVVEDHPRLRMAGGKKIFELRPAIEWDKGRAVEWVLDAVAGDGNDRAGGDRGNRNLIPVYIGDDETDEDAFIAIRGHGDGVGIVVGDEDRVTAARYRLTDPSEAVEFMERLATRVATGTSGEGGEVDV